MNNILLSGFAPFAHHTHNPSMSIVQELHNRTIDQQARIIGVVLPVVQQRCIEILKEQILLHKPVAVLALGVSSRPTISIERVAINIDDFSIPDNAGNQPCDQSIVTEAPPAYWSTLPIKDLYTCARNIHPKVEISNSAGTFVCNHLFFQLQHMLSFNSIISGFVHIPTTDVIEIQTQRSIVFSMLSLLAHQ